MEGECPGRSHSVNFAYRLLLTHHCLLGEMEPSETIEHSVLHHIRYNQRNICCRNNYKRHSYFLVFDTQKPTKFQVRVQSTNRLMLLPTLNLCILLLIFRLLLQSGDIEANPGPTLGKRCLLMSNCSSTI